RPDRSAGGRPEAQANLTAGPGPPPEAAMRTVVEYGLANAVAATLLALMAFSVGLLVRRPAVRNALWALVLVRLLLPPVWTIPISIPMADSARDEPAVALASPDPLPALEPAPFVECDGVDDEALVNESDVAPTTSELTPAAAAAEPSNSVSAFGIAAVVWL